MLRFDRIRFEPVESPGAPCSAEEVINAWSRPAALQRLGSNFGRVKTPCQIVDRATSPVRNNRYRAVAFRGADALPR